MSLSLTKVPWPSWRGPRLGRWQILLATGVGSGRRNPTPAAATRADHTVVIGDGFDEFFQREFVTMVAIAEATSGDPSAAEDIAAEAMSRAHQRWDKVSGHDKPGAWVRRVTINLAISRRRHLGVAGRSLRSQRREDLVEQPPDADHPVWEQVARLAPQQRAAIALFYIEDLSVTEIAEILECRVSTATTHLDRGRQRLAELLTEGGDR